MNAKDLSIELSKYGELPVRLIGSGDIDQVRRADRLNAERSGLEDAVLIFGESLPGEENADHHEKLQAIIAQIEEWQGDDSKVTGIDLLLQIKDTLTDMVSLGDTEEVS